MDPFQAGFIKFAEDECALSREGALCAYKRAMEYPPAQELFNNINPASDTSVQHPSDTQPESYAALAELLEQEKIRKQMHGYKQQLGAL